jgi:predicted transcriptional regulator
MTNDSLHKAETHILRIARRSKTARFSDLMKPTELTSDSFKFHLRKLVQAGHLTKQLDGTYTLTPAGKEFANALDRDRHAVRKQPKLSVMIVLADDQTPGRYLFHERLRNPFWGYWGLLSGPIRWGETPEQCASRELAKQTGLRAQFTVAGCLRKRDYSTAGAQLLEDKQFIIVTGSKPQGELSNEWPGGRSCWMSVDELKQQPRYYKDTEAVLDMIADHQFYREVDGSYEPDEY